MYIMYLYFNTLKKINLKIQYEFLCRKRVTQKSMSFVCCIWKELWDGTMDVDFLFLLLDNKAFQNVFKFHDKNSIGSKKIAENHRGLLPKACLCLQTTISTETALLQICNTDFKQWLLNHTVSEDKVPECWRVSSGTLLRITHARYHHFL